MDANPYATPRVELVEQGIPDAFRRRWTLAQLRILAWLCLASIAGGVVLMVLSLLEAFGDGAAFRVYATGWACSSACSAPTCCCGSSTWSSRAFAAPRWPGRYGCRFS